MSVLNKDMTLEQFSDCCGEGADYLIGTGQADEIPLNDKGYWMLAMILYASMTEEQKRIYESKNQFCSFLA